MAEGQEILQARLGLPPGYYLTWGGAFENQQRAMQRLRLIVPVTVAVIFLLLFMTFNSVRYAALIILNLPLALIGGILGLLVTGLYLSVPAAVGLSPFSGWRCSMAWCWSPNLTSCARRVCPWRKRCVRGVNGGCGRC